MDRVERLPVIGVDRYCPSCRRKLVSFNPDGTFDLAGLASIRGSAQQTLDEYGDVEEPQDMVITEAVCFRRTCRLKRWLRTHNPRRS
jgi:hypothetical protein